MSTQSSVALIMIPGSTGLGPLVGKSLLHDHEPFSQRNYRGADLYNHVYLSVVKRVSRKFRQDWIDVLKCLYPWGIVLRSSLLVIRKPDVGVVQPGSNIPGSPEHYPWVGKPWVGQKHPGLSTWEHSLSVLTADSAGELTPQEPSVNKG